MDNSQSCAQKFRVTSEEALRRISSYGGDIIVDLDETLYLRNSTEDYIASARPAVLAFLVLRLIEILKPWRILGGENTKDVWRVRAICWLFPWTFYIWRQRVRDLSSRYVNKPLIAELKKKKGRFSIATLGFAEIVAPLVNAMGLSQVQIISCRIANFDDRRRGKLSLVCEAIGREKLRNAMVVSDSVDDAELFDVCDEPLLAQWPTAKYERAFKHTYIPFQYLNDIKRPGSNALKAIVADDLMLWIMAGVPYTILSPLRLIGVLFLFASFWSIYEFGYIENDLVAANLEDDPKLSMEFFSFELESVGLKPWLYAMGWGAIAIFCFQYTSTESFLEYFLCWCSVLVLLRLFYRIYNYLDKATRLWLYLGLSVIRSASLIAVVPLRSAGILACMASAIARWISYIVYRHGYRVGFNSWPSLEQGTLRLELCLVLMLVGIVLGLFSREDLLVAALILSWNAFVARHELFRIFMNARWLSNSRTEPISRSRDTDKSAP